MFEFKPPSDCPRLFPAGIPSAPTGLRVLNQTGHSIVISWVPGFDAFSALNSCRVQVSVRNPLCICTLPSYRCSEARGNLCWARTVWIQPER